MITYDLLSFLLGITSIVFSSIILTECVTLINLLSHTDVFNLHNIHRWLVTTALCSLSLKMTGQQVKSL
jgi:hypothetical protein